MLGDERALFIMTVFRRTVIDAVGGFDPALFTNEEYEMWIRASLAGFTFARHPKPLGWYTCRPDSLSSSDTRMLSGILQVFAKTRPALPEGSAERAVLDRQVARFEVELLAAEARNGFIRGDARGRAAPGCAARAPRRLEALARRGGHGLAPGARARGVSAATAQALARTRGRPCKAAARRASGPRPAGSCAYRAARPSIRRSATRSDRGACWSTSATRCTPPSSSRSPTALEARSARRRVLHLRAPGRGRRRPRRQAAPAASSPTAQRRGGAGISI